MQHNKLTYLGTWQIQFMNLGPGSKIEGKVGDQQDEASDALKQFFAGPPRPITKGLLESAKDGSLSLVRPRAEQ